MSGLKGTREEEMVEGTREDRLRGVRLRGMDRTLDVSDGAIRGSWRWIDEGVCTVCGKQPISAKAVRSRSDSATAYIQSQSCE